MNVPSDFNRRMTSKRETSVSASSLGSSDETRQMSRYLAWAILITAVWFDMPTQNLARCSSPSVDDEGDAAPCQENVGNGSGNPSWISGGRRRDARRRSGS